jgi:ribosome-interacting GTPase 1
MPTNVTPEYKKAEEAFRAAKSLDEKIERLEYMISLLPKHKGTDHLYADLKRRMSRLRKQLEESTGRKTGGAQIYFTREGAAAQVILVGPPNSGKSSILGALSNAHPEIAEYPFTTDLMQPGMVPYRDIRIQLVDSPPVTADFMPMHLLSLVRGADAVLLVADLSRDSILDDIDVVFEAFSLRHVQFVPRRDEAGLDAILCRIIANKSDKPNSEDRLELLREQIGERLEIVPISCSESGNVTMIPEMIFQWLKIIRVYTKIPGKKPDMGHPYTVFEGQTVEDICALVHRDFFDNLRFARLWRERKEPITVSRSEKVCDGDILELHI